MNSYGILQLTYYIYAPDHCHDIGVWTSWRSPVTHIRVIQVYSFPFNVIHLYTFTNAFLKVQNIMIKELYHTNDIPSSQESVAFECSWYPVEDKQDTCWRSAGNDMQTYYLYWNSYKDLNLSVEMSLKF